MGPREFWTPGKVLPDTARAKHHLVWRSFFTGNGHSGLLLSHAGTGVGWAVWEVDVYGKPVIRDWSDDRFAALVFYRRKVDGALTDAIEELS